MYVCVCVCVGFLENRDRQKEVEHTEREREREQKLRQRTIQKEPRGMRKGKWGLGRRGYIGISQEVEMEVK